MRAISAKTMDPEVVATARYARSTLLRRTTGVTRSSTPETDSSTPTVFIRTKP